MKLFSKMTAVVLSAVMILLFAVPAAGAAQTAPCPQVKVIRCEAPGCSEIQKLMDRFCSGGICLNDILKSLKGYCPDGDCCVLLPDKSVCPSEVPAEPTAVPVDSVETPAEPSVVPTEKSVVPAVDPTEPVAVPTQPIIIPTEAAVIPTEQPTEPIVTPAETIAPKQPGSAEFNTAYEAQVLRLVNNERAKYGLAPLSIDDGAVQVAHLRAKEIVQNFSHTRPDGSSCFTAAKEFGVSFRTAGENIAYGYPTPEQVVNGWMNSEGHRKNILSASFSKIGIGCYESRGVLYWSQFFIG